MPESFIFVFLSLLYSMNDEKDGNIEKKNYSSAVHVAICSTAIVGEGGR
jgi:hypothetical protein